MRALMRVPQTLAEAAPVPSVAARMMSTTPPRPSLKVATPPAVAPPVSQRGWQRPQWLDADRSLAKHQFKDQGGLRMHELKKMMIFSDLGNPEGDYPGLEAVERSEQHDVFGAAQRTLLKAARRGGVDSDMHPVVAGPEGADATVATPVVKPVEGKWPSPWALEKNLGSLEAHRRAAQMPDPQEGVPDRDDIKTLDVPPGTRAIMSTPRHNPGGRFPSPHDRLLAALGRAELEPPRPESESPSKQLYAGRDGAKLFKELSERT